MSIWDSRSFYNPQRHADEEINRIMQCYDIKEIDKLIESTINYLKLVEKVLANNYFLQLITIEGM